MGNAGGTPVSVGPSTEVAEELAAKDKEIAILKHKIYELDLHRGDAAPLNSVTVPHTNSTSFVSHHALYFTRLHHCILPGKCKCHCPVPWADAHGDRFCTPPAQA